MNIKTLSPIIAAAAIAVGATPAMSEANAPEANIFCQMQGNTPTTVARTQNGDLMPIFHWKNEALPVSMNGQQLCQDVANKLENHFASGREVVAFSSHDLMLPTVCAEETLNQCDLVLFTLPPTENSAIDESNRVLDEILDSRFKTETTASTKRGVQSTRFEMPQGLWQLIIFSIN